MAAHCHTMTNKNGTTMCWPASRAAGEGAVCQGPARLSQALARGAAPEMRVWESDDEDACDSVMETWP